MVRPFFSEGPYKLAILGDGLTAKATRATLQRIVGFEESEVSVADFIVASPGIPPEQYPNTDLEIISEPEFAYRLFHRPESSYVPKIIGVTGTNGKSTVTAMLAEYLRAPALGNIGLPLISMVDRPSASEWIVVELSSYQLDGAVFFKPDLALLLNITEDHMSRYRSMSEYCLSKKRLFTTMDDKGLLLFNSDCPNTSSIVSDCPAQIEALSYDDISQDISSVSPMIARHHQFNAFFVKRALSFISGESPSMTPFLTQFKFLEHRVETVDSVNGVLFVNDSKSTNPDSTLKAVESFSSPIHLLLCGVDKGLDMAPLMTVLQAQVKSITVFGDIAEKLQSVSQELDPDFDLFLAESLEDAFSHVLSLLDDGDTVLFSPGSASFDQFDNFEHRGNTFKERVFQYRDSPR